MAAYILRTETTVPLDIKRVFAFFADARNLNSITPPWLHFTLKTDGSPAMRPGLLLDYRIRLYLIPIRWRTEITVWDPPKRFVDEQRQAARITGGCTPTRSPRSKAARRSKTKCSTTRAAARSRTCCSSKRNLRRIFRYRHHALREALGVPDDGVRARVRINRSR